VLPIFSNSTIFVILTLPTLQRIRPFPCSMVAAKDADFRVSAQWIIRPARALIDVSGKERQAKNARRSGGCRN